MLDITNYYRFRVGWGIGVGWGVGAYFFFVCLFVCLFFSHLFKAVGFFINHCGTGGGGRAGLLII